MDNLLKIRCLKVSVPIDRVIGAMRFLKNSTKVSSFHSAMALIHFKDLSEKEQEDISLLITIWRAWKDGEVEPEFDIERIYSSELDSPHFLFSSNNNSNTAISHSR